MTSISMPETALSAATKILLAPMEGVVDSEMRRVFTCIGGFDRCVTEFVRVTENKIPNHVFYKYSPELKCGGVTEFGTPVFVQLLGGNVKAMAFNAKRLEKLGPPGIDLNFGCPSKTVNKREGGSVLLREPQRVESIIKAVRDAVDSSIPVTAKIRLGFDDSADFEEIAERAINAGVSELCVHARTKADGYKPPAHWAQLKRIESIGASNRCPVIVNGDIWSVGTAESALSSSGAQHLMLGRGALRCPDLAQQIKKAATGQQYSPLPWAEVLSILLSYLSASSKTHPDFIANRAKQWIGFLQFVYPEAADVFATIKRLKVADDVKRSLRLCLDTAA